MTKEDKALEFVATVGRSIASTLHNMLFNAYLAGYTQAQEDAKEKSRIVLPQ